MTEDEYRAAIHHERMAAVGALERMLRDWRRELWPDPTTDPIAQENRMRRFRRELAVQAYWGAAIRRPMYGGICGA